MSMAAFDSRFFRAADMSAMDQVDVGIRRNRTIALMNISGWSRSRRPVLPLGQRFEARSVIRLIVSFEISAPSVSARVRGDLAPAIEPFAEGELTRPGFHAVLRWE